MKNVELVIKNAQKQDQKAFNNLFNLHWDYLYNFQLKKTRNKDLAEEISIITFARAFDRISTFKNQFEFKTWLLTISKNIYNDQLRKENNSINLMTFPSIPDLKELTNQDHPSPEEILITNEKLESLLNKIKSLKSDYRKIIQLRFFDDLSYKEISKKMDQPINTIKVKLLRAKNLLNQKFRQMLAKLKKLGPGLLFAGASVGVSHLVQSTRAGADFGWGLLWALLLVNLFKYPFFEFGPRYALVTGKSLLDGYYKLGKIYLWLYFFKYRYDVYNPNRGYHCNSGFSV